MNGAAYIRDYNYKMMPGSGPYVITEQDVNKGNSVRIRKRNDYWAEKDRRNVGLNNFATINQQVVRDENLEFERVKRGDLDLFVLTRAQQWVQELDYPEHQARPQPEAKDFQQQPAGIQGVAMNTRREPYNDVRVRKALRHLFNRELMIQKLAFNEYLPMDSHVLRQRVREPGQRERSNTIPRKRCSCWRKPDGRTATRPDASPAAANLYPGNRLWNAGLRTLLHRVPGRSAQGRHHAESPARDVGDA